MKIGAFAAHIGKEFVPQNTECSFADMMHGHSFNKLTSGHYIFWGDTAEVDIPVFRCFKAIKDFLVPWRRALDSLVYHKWVHFCFISLPSYLHTLVPHCSTPGGF
jgi:hypothetical protein